MAFVYIWRYGTDDIFKIGRTINLAARRRTLSTGSPIPLEDFDVIETDEAPLGETYLHKLLRSKRITDSGARDIFGVTPDELRPAIQETREFLTEFVEKKRAVDALAIADSDGKLLIPTERDLETHRQLVECRESIDRLTYERLSLETILKARIGTCDGLDQVATWRTKTVNRLDTMTLKVREPEVYEQYLKATRSRVFRLK